MAIKIVFANHKGGVGKSTTSICVAQELIRREYKVLFIDGDRQGNASTFYRADYENETTIIDILAGDVPAKECVQHTEKGDIIAFDEQLENADTIVRPDELRFLHLKRSCKTVENDYDYIIIDTPPAIDVVTKNALASADYVVIPTDESGWSVGGIMKFSKAVEMAKETTNPNIKVAGVLIVKGKTFNKSKRAMENCKKICTALNTMTFSNVIRESSACQEALTEFCVPLREYAPHGTTTLDYDHFVDELLEVI